MIAMDECRQLIWDYTHGEVVCMDTGEVVDRIYDYGPVHVGEEAREWARAEERKRLRRYGYRADRELRRLKHRLRKHYRLLRLARSITSRGYMVDEERLLRQGRFVLTVYSRKSIEVLDWFEKRGYARSLTGSSVFSGKSSLWLLIGVFAADTCYPISSTSFSEAAILSPIETWMG